MFSKLLSDRGDSVVVSIGNGIEVADREKRAANFYMYNSGWCLPFHTNSVGLNVPVEIVDADRWVRRSMRSCSLYMPDEDLSEMSVCLWKGKRYAIRSIKKDLLTAKDLLVVNRYKWKAPSSLKYIRVGDFKRVKNGSSKQYFYNNEGREVDERVDTFYLEVKDEAISVYEDKNFSDCIDLWFYD